MNGRSSLNCPHCRVRVGFNPHGTTKISGEIQKDDKFIYRCRECNGRFAVRLP